MPFKNTPLSTEHSDMLIHNKQILIKFCINQGLSRIGDKYFINEKTGDAGRGSVDLDKLWSTSTKYHRQLNAGVISSFESYSDSYTSEKKVKVSGSIIWRSFNFFTHCFANIQVRSAIMCSNTTIIISFLRE